MNKELIKRRFTRKLSVYNENARIQRQMAEKLLTFLPNNNYKSILELGCGTGILTELAVQNLQFSEYTALDIIPQCEKYIKEINTDINFVANEIEEFINTDNKKYDLIISNASFQWIENFSDFIKNLKNKLTDSGNLLFSTFGKENFREIYFTMGKTLSYYSPKELKNILDSKYVTIEDEIRVMAFKTPKEVLKHISSTGVNALSCESWTKKDLINFEKEYNAFCSYHPTLTYNPIYVLI